MPEQNREPQKSGGRTERIVEVGFYDEVEEYENCTVQILSNSVTGDISVGWWKNDG